MNNNLLTSSLFDEKNFYPVFIKDLERCTKEVYIESLYLTNNLTKLFYPFFTNLLAKGVKIFVVTRCPEDHTEENLKYQALEAIRTFERIGVQALLCTNNHHRKLAILDRKILWEGSLNILSQVYSRELMRRMESVELAMQMFNFLKLQQFLG